MPRRYFHRTDVNQPDIVKALRALGLRVHCWGEEADLIVQYGGMTMLCEVRPEGAPRKARKGRQKEFQEHFMVHWLQSTDDCLNLAKTLRRWQESVSECIEEV
jgi:hypothetical protein